MDAAPRAASAAAFERAERDAAERVRAGGERRGPSVDGDQQHVMSVYNVMRNSGRGSLGGGFFLLFDLMFELKLIDRTNKYNQTLVPHPSNSFMCWSWALLCMASFGSP